MFTALSEQLSGVLKRLTGRGVLSESDVTEALREIRRHLLEADVSFEVTRGFVERIRERAVGALAIDAVRPGQQVVKLVHDEIVTLLGGARRELAFASVGPTTILLVGLQGSGKTTTAAKLARRLKLEQKAPALVAADPYRPAAVEQLRQLGAQVGVPVFPGVGSPKGQAGESSVPTLVRDALREA
ncbi:MAG TPA: signal recognition particle receptor subunit alpha, partial [Gemmatimonadales bacterium]|nr:signal recognition particle receptor subunit alpha [Gemmatimonadales bacterium]